MDEEEVGSLKVVVLRGSQLPGLALNSLRHQSATDWGGHLFLCLPPVTQVVPAALMLISMDLENEAREDE